MFLGKFWHAITTGSIVGQVRMPDEPSENILCLYIMIISIVEHYLDRGVMLYSPCCRRRCDQQNLLLSNQSLQSVCFQSTKKHIGLANASVLPMEMLGRMEHNSNADRCMVVTFGFLC